MKDLNAIKLSEDYLFEHFKENLIALAETRFTEQTTHKPLEIIGEGALSKSLDISNERFFNKQVIVLNDLAKSVNHCIQDYINRSKTYDIDTSLIIKDLGQRINAHWGLDEFDNFQKKAINKNITEFFSRKLHLADMQYRDPIIIENELTTYLENHQAFRSKISDKVQTLLNEKLNLEVINSTTHAANAKLSIKSPKSYASSISQILSNAKETIKKPIKNFLPSYQRKSTGSLSVK